MKEKDDYIAMLEQICSNDSIQQTQKANHSFYHTH